MLRRCSLAARVEVSTAVVVSFANFAKAADADPVRGPFWSGTIMRDKSTPAAMKGSAVTLGAGKINYVV